MKSLNLNLKNLQQQQPNFKPQLNRRTNLNNFNFQQTNKSNLQQILMDNNSTQCLYMSVFFCKSEKLNFEYFTLY